MRWRQWNLIRTRSSLPRRQNAKQQCAGPWALPSAMRSAMVLHVQQDMTYEQVAEHMGVSRRAVKRYIAKGYAATRVALAGIETAGEPYGGKGK